MIMKYTTNCNNDLTSINDTAKSLLLKRVITDRRDSIKTLTEYVSHLFEYSKDRNLINTPNMNYGSCSIQQNGRMHFNTISYRFKDKGDGCHQHYEGMDGIMAHNDGNVYLGSNDNRFYVINAITKNRNMEHIVVIESLPLDLLFIDYTTHYYDTMYDYRYEWDDIFRLRTITIFNVDEQTTFTYFPNKAVHPKNVRSRDFKKSIGSLNINKLTIKYNGLMPNVHDELNVTVHNLKLKALANICNHKVANLLNGESKDTNPTVISFEHSFYEQFRTDDESVNELLYQELKEESLRRYDRDDVFTDMSLDMLSLINNMCTMSYYTIYDEPENRPFSIRNFLIPSCDDTTDDTAPNPFKEKIMEIMKHPSFKDGALFKIDNSGDEPTVKVTRIGRQILKDLKIDATQPSMGLLFGYPFLRDVIYPVYFDKDYIKDFLKRTCHV